MVSVISVGLDGATWRLLDRWVGDGSLPTLSRMLDDGVRADLQSYLPPVTAPNWKCFSTGRNPGALGVYWWETLTQTADGYEIGRPSSRSYRQPELWEFLGERGTTSAVVNMPTTYPPTEIDGYMVAGGPDAEESGFATPESLEDRLREQYDYRCLPERLALLKDRDGDAIEEAIDLVETRFDVATDLGSEAGVEYLHVTVYLTNVFHHFFWDEEATRRLWTVVDDGLEHLLETFEDATVLLFSDHGSNETDLKFYVNLWLAEQGYLATDDSGPRFGRALYALGLNRDRLDALATRLGVKGALKRLLSERLVNAVPTKTGSIRLEAKNDLIDWANTDAFAFGQGPVYVFDDEKRDEIREQLTTLEHGGTPIASAVHDGEDIYAGPHADSAPDLVVEQHEGVHISNSLGYDETFVEPDHWRAENERRGIFAAYGPGVAGDADLETVSILDVAPTVMALLDEPVPEAMEGEPIPVGPERCRAVDRASYDLGPSPGDGTDVNGTRQRLEDLGYLE